MQGGVGGGRAGSVQYDILISSKGYMQTHGTVYSLTNCQNNTCYIGSTTYKNPKNRYSHHISLLHSLTRKNYPELFDNGNPDWCILHQGTYNNRKELREKENDYINSYRYNQSLNVVNRYKAYQTPEELKEMRKKAKQKYYKSWKGKERKKWNNYRGRMRKKLLSEIHDKLTVIN
jgi:predicted GIY-YIG superfamily endonuclease